jgi:hypothetical protein
VKRVPGNSGPMGIVLITTCLASASDIESSIIAASLGGACYASTSWIHRTSRIEGFSLKQRPVYGCLKAKSLCATDPMEATSNAETTCLSDHSVLLVLRPLAQSYGSLRGCRLHRPSENKAINDSCKQYANSTAEKAAAGLLFLPWPVVKYVTLTHG